MILGDLASGVMNHPFEPRLSHYLYSFPFYFFSVLLIPWESMSHNVTEGVTKDHIKKVMSLVMSQVTYSLVAFAG